MIVDVALPSAAPRGAGALIVNADDWGRDRRTTNRILDCARGGGVSAVSGMVFMDDSERAASIARERGLDTGLHLNVTLPFTSRACPAALLTHQRRLVGYLRRHPLARVVYNPRLAESFRYVVAAQLDEFRRLYDAAPERIDGHHHMHLCANVQFQRLLPAGTLVRRNFSFQRGEKSAWNRFYRRLGDAMLSRRHRVVDYLFPLAPVEPVARLQRIFSLAREFVVEVETHPVNRLEHRFLARGEIFRQAGDVRIAAPSSLRAARPHVSIGS